MVINLLVYEILLMSALAILAVFLVYTYMIYVVGLCMVYAMTRLYFHMNKSYVSIGRKAILITGCDTGFGYHLAKHLAVDGYVVYAGVLHINGPGAKQLRTLGTKSMHTVKLDVTNEDDIREVLHQIKTQTKKNGLWGLVNNAGFNIFGDVELATIEQYKKCAEVNLYGTIRMTKTFLPMIRENKGRIVNISSVRGLYSAPECSVYHTTKYGIETLSDCLRLEMKQFGVKVSVVNPANYDGATACRSPERIAFLRSEIDAQFVEATDEVKEVYGYEYFCKSIQKDFQAAGAKSPMPVLDAICDALLNVKPSPRYLVPGGSGIIDIGAELARFHNFIPTSVNDRILLWRTGYNNARD